MACSVSEQSRGCQKKIFTGLRIVCRDSSVGCRVEGFEPARQRAPEADLPRNEVSIVDAICRM